ncbi:hypothetical protein C4D60_Mb06t12130 [Musa balbisiana]|uniref:Uncharacterized protein n=1 Tax=Musa balbisiana TaxID=52838 RepID=A0A4S8INS1_MUSBA|nr:hypothetical protein C4D60_Mb06t12130 [Musa balbisiana]
MEERWARGKSGSGHQNPSFSSTLLDAIYRSIDESDGGATSDRHSLITVPKRPPQPLRSAAEWRTAEAATRCRPLAPISTSSSSDKSSYGGFSSSSEPDSGENRLRPILTVGAPIRSIPPPPAAAVFDRREEEKKKKKTGSIRGRLRDARSSRSAAPASPGARLAGFLGSVLSAVSVIPRRPTTTAITAAGGCDDSACSTASSLSRSCLIKKPSTREQPPSGEGEKRSVRFCPVSVIVDEDLRPCGHKSVYGADTAPRRPSAVAMKARRRVEELLRGMEEEEEEMSDSSSDLFELQNLTVIGRERGRGRGRGVGGGYGDELPVYETAHLDMNRSIPQSQRFLKIQERM